MTKIKVISDMHLEFWDFNKIPKIMDRKFPVALDDEDTILCCAGDIGLFSKYASTYKPFFQLMSTRFKHVIVVPGNHSYYNSSEWGNENDYWKDKKIPYNVHYLDNKSIIIDDILFIGSCLWTDFNNSDPIAMLKASRGMNDFITIKKKESEVVADYGQIIQSNRLSPEDTVIRHKESVAFIKKELSEYPDMKTVVVTHHGASSSCVPNMYRGDGLNPAYYTNLEDLILDNQQIKYWFSGHTHTSLQFEIGFTKYIINPFGYYYQEENMNFDPNLVVEL
jgi:hypothetical protein